MILDNILSGQGHQNGRICGISDLFSFTIKKRSSIIHEITMGLDFSDPKNFTREDREIKKGLIWGVKLAIYVIFPKS